MIREAIERFVESEAPVSSESLLEGMRDLLGKYSGPGDLATNPKYMEEFGRERRGDRGHRPTRRRLRSK